MGQALFNGFWGEVEASTVEVDRVDEVPLVAEASRRVLDPLNLRVADADARVQRWANLHMDELPANGTGGTRPTFPAG
jgi:hypothetical protein